MDRTNKISVIKARRSLRDYIRLVLALYVCQVLLSVYQNLILYSDGVLDNVFNKSLLLQCVNHAGFTALTGLFLAFVYNILERRKAGAGFSVMYGLFTFLLVAEGVLILYFTRNYELFEAGFAESVYVGDYWLPSIILIALSLLSLWGFYRVMARVYHQISKMYPFTIILFSFFLASLMADKKPVNENKTQHVLETVMMDFWEDNKYEGEAEFPLLNTYIPDHSLAPYFNLGTKKPNLVFIIVDGLGSDFLDEDARYPGFTPFLDSLRGSSLYWNKFVSNTGVSQAALASVVGSLPFGEKGFTHLEDYVNRQTLFSILKRNGYRTAFHFGGNTALDHWDRFLLDEKVDGIYDDKGFSNIYEKQGADAAGISLGFPDKALFERWASQQWSYERPRMDCFVTLSSKTPFLIPQRESYIERVRKILEGQEWSSQLKRLISKNEEKFASILYTDEALKEFMASHRGRPGFDNTIFLITGTHNMAELPQESPLDRYKVPLMVYSPLLKDAANIPAIASHADLLPSIVGLLEHSYDMELPAAVSWLGRGLISENEPGEQRFIPMLRHENSIQDIIWGDYFLSGGDLYSLDSQLVTKEADHWNLEEQIEDKFRFFKSVNAYVTRHNKLIPESLALNTRSGLSADKQQLVWIQSVFNGSNYDNAYDTARQLALDGNRERALLLCRHILEKVPGHADTEILMGRIYGWQEEYGQAAEILQNVIRKYPVYTDGYLALLDVYYWAGEYGKALELDEMIRENNLRNLEIEEKIKRAFEQKNRVFEEELKEGAHAQATITSTQEP